MTAPRLYGLGEIADAIGVPAPTVTVWRNRGKLPRPDAMLRMGPVWTARTIEPWIGRFKRARA